MWRFCWKNQKAYDWIKWKTPRRLFPFKRSWTAICGASLLRPKVSWVTYNMQCSWGVWSTTALMYTVKWSLMYQFLSPLACTKCTNFSMDWSNISRHGTCRRSFREGTEGSTYLKYVVTGNMPRRNHVGNKVDILYRWVSTRLLLHIKSRQFESFNDSRSNMEQHHHPSQGRKTLYPTETLTKQAQSSQKEWGEGLEKLPQEKNTCK